MRLRNYFNENKAINDKDTGLVAEIVKCSNKHFDTNHVNASCKKEILKTHIKDKVNKKLENNPHLKKHRGWFKIIKNLITSVLGFRKTETERKISACNSTLFIKSKPSNSNKGMGLGFSECLAPGDFTLPKMGGERS